MTAAGKTTSHQFNAWGSKQHFQNVLSQLIICCLDIFLFYTRSTMDLPEVGRGKDSSIVNAIYLASGIGIPFSLFFLGQSLYTANFIVKQWRIQDYMIVPAWILTTTAQVFVLICLYSSLLDVHVKEMSFDDATWATKLILAATLLFIPGIALAKLVLRAVYCQIFHLTSGSYVVYGTIALIITPSTLACITLLFACIPIGAARTLQLFAVAKFIDPYLIYILQAGIECMADLVLTVFTLVAFLRLQNTRKDKASLVAFWCTSQLPPGATVARMVILFTRRKSLDTTLVMAPAMLCFIVEANLAIICGSLPTFRKFIRHVKSRVSQDQPSLMDGNINGAQGLRLQGGVLRSFGCTVLGRSHSSAGSPREGSVVELIGGRTDREEV